MKRPNSELFRLVRFAIRYPGWHTYGQDARPHLLRAEAAGLVVVDPLTKQFRLARDGDAERRGAKTA